MITLKQIKNIITDILNDDNWVNDSQTFAEKQINNIMYQGQKDGFEMLVRHLEELKKDDNIEDLIT